MRRYLALVGFCICGPNQICGFTLLKSRSRVLRVKPLYATLSPEDEYRESILDSLIQRQASKPIIQQWSPQRSSLWSRFHGTVLRTSLAPSAASSVVSLIACILLKNEIVPYSMEFLKRVGNLWHMHLTATSFFLTFFLSASKVLYDSVLTASRSLQGRLNDLNLIAASAACRDENGTMTTEAQETVTTLSRYISLFSIFFYSSTVQRYKCLMDDKALQGLATRGMLTDEEVKLLQRVDPPERSHSILNWIISTFTRGCEDACFRMPAKTHIRFLTKSADARARSADIDNRLSTRCPVAYVHLIQLLVDSFLFLTPLAAIADMGWLAPAGTFLMSVFFFGLLDLSKVLYDPLGNGDFGGVADSLQTDVLIQESSGGSQRYLSTGLELPVEQIGLQ